MARPASPRPHDAEPLVRDELENDVAPEERASCFTPIARATGKGIMLLSPLAPSARQSGAFPNARCASARAIARRFFYRHGSKAFWRRAGGANRERIAWILLVVGVVALTVLLFAWRMSLQRVSAESTATAFARKTALLAHERTPREQLLSSWLGKQAYLVKSNAVCFKYSSDAERTQYGNPDAPVACYVENLCYNNTWTIPAAEDEPLDAQTGPILFAARDYIRRRPPSPVLPFPLLKEDTLVVASRFECHNPVHHTEEFAASVFQQLAAIGKYNLATLQLDRRSTRLRIMREFEGVPNCPFDGMFDALSAHPVDHEMPEQPFCVRNAWVGLTFGVNPSDGRFEFQPPQYRNPEPKPDYMLFGRHIVRWVLNRLYGQRYDALLASKQPLRKQFDVLSTAKWLAEREREFFALEASAQSMAHAPTPPMLNTTAQVLNQTGLLPGGWTTGSRLLLLRRTGKRVVENQEQLDAAVLDAFAARGYPVHITSFESSMSLEAQVLSVATSTVYTSGHGAGLGHCIYLPPGGGLMEMIRRGGFEQWFSKYSADMQLRYYRYTNIHDGRQLTKHSPYRVEIPAVIDMLTVALYMSDATFGPPASVTRRITVDEAVSAAANSIGGMSLDSLALLGLPPGPEPVGSR